MAAGLLSPEFGLLSLPNDVMVMVTEMVVSSISVQDALNLRLVSKSFQNLINGAICNLPMFETSEPLSRLPQLPASITTQLILLKCRAANADQRPLCHAIEEAVQYGANILGASSTVSEEACRHTLAAAAAHTLFLVDIIPNLYPAASSTPQSDLNTSLVVVVCKCNVHELRKIDSFGIRALQKTRFFGTALRCAALLGSTEALQLIVDDIKGIDLDRKQTQSIRDAFEQAAACGHPEIVDTIRRGRQDWPLILPYDLATKAAIRNQRNEIAMTLAELGLFVGFPSCVASVARMATAYSCNNVVQILLSRQFLPPTPEDISTYVEEACRYNNVDMIRLLAPHFARICLTGPLFWAAYFGNHEILDLLLLQTDLLTPALLLDALAGAALNNRARTIQHILQCSDDSTTTITGGFSTAVDLLLDGKRHVNFCYQPTKMPKAQFRFKQDTYEISYDRTEGWNSSMPYPSEPDQLRLACERGAVHDARDLITSYREKYPTQSLDLFGASCSMALRANRPGLLYYICQYVPPYLIEDPLMDPNSTALLQVVFALGWDVNWALRADRPPLLGHAVKNEYMTRWLLHAGADPNERCHWDYTPMTWAMILASMDTIKLLFAWGASIRHGQMLHYAVDHKSYAILDLIDLLLGLDMDINELQFSNDRRTWMDLHRGGLGTPLHCAAARGRSDLADYLLLNGADPSLRDSRGRLAHEIAESKGHASLAANLRELQPSINTVHVPNDWTLGSYWPYSCNCIPFHTLQPTNWFCALSRKIGVSTGGVLLLTCLLQSGQTKWYPVYPFQQNRVRHG